MGLPSLIGDLTGAFYYAKDSENFGLNLNGKVRFGFFWPEYSELVYTTQVNSTFRARWLASSEVISQVLFTSEQPKKN